MASHNLAVRGAFTLNSGVTLEQIWWAMCEFALDRGIELDRLPETDTGDLEFVDEENVVTYSEGRALFIHLSITGVGHGSWPDAADEMLEKLSELCDEGGALELFDHDLSATNGSECKSVRFIGSTDQAKRIAQIKYGLTQAEEWLKPVIGSAGFDSVVKAAMLEVAS